MLVTEYYVAITYPPKYASRYNEIIRSLAKEYEYNDYDAGTFISEKGEPIQRDMSFYFDSAKTARSFRKALEEKNMHKVRVSKVIKNEYDNSDTNFLPPSV